MLPAQHIDVIEKHIDMLDGPLRAAAAVNEWYAAYASLTHPLKEAGWRQVDKAAFGPRLVAANTGALVFNSASEPLKDFAELAARKSDYQRVVNSPRSAWPRPGHQVDVFAHPALPGSFVVVLGSDGGGSREIQISTDLLMSEDQRRRSQDLDEILYQLRFPEHEEKARVDEDALVAVWGRKYWNHTGHEFGERELNLSWCSQDRINAFGTRGYQMFPLTIVVRGADGG